MCFFLGMLSDKMSVQTTEVSTSSKAAAAAKKFAQKSPEEILKKHGFDKIMQQIQDIKEQLNSPAFETFLVGPDAQVFNDKITSLRKVALAAQKATVSLDIKVKKWKEVPADVAAVLLQTRQMTKSVVDASNSFITNRKKADASKMERARAAMQAADLEVPLSFHVLYFKEKAMDLGRFRNSADLVHHIKTGLVETRADDADVRGLTEETLGHPHCHFHLCLVL